MPVWHLNYYSRMKTLFKISVVAAFAVGGIFALSARKSGKKPAQQSTTYYYYPKVNVYYDVANGTYIYLADDGKTWQSAKQVADKLGGGMGKKAVLINPPLPVWKSNEHHRMIYSTALYASAKDFRKTTPAKTPAAVKKPAEVKKAPEKKDDKKDSGIERFFKRLFKKKETAKDKKA